MRRHKCRICGKRRNERYMSLVFSHSLLSHIRFFACKNGCDVMMCEIILALRTDNVMLQIECPAVLPK